MAVLPHYSVGSGGVWIGATSPQTPPLPTIKLPGTSFVISLTSITRAILIWFNVCGVIWRRSATKDRKKAGRRGLSLPASLYMMRGSPLDRRAVKMIYAVFDHRPARQHTLLRRLVHDRD